VSLVDRMQAAVYDAMGARFEKRHGARMRRRQLAPAHGRVLEIGGGTGANLAFYPDAVEELIVTEPNDGMLRRARRRLEANPRAATLVQASADDLPFADDSFDTAVSTVVLCSVPDQAAALREVRRVLRPGGRLLFAEHVRSDDPGRAKWQDRLERPWTKIANGCHPNRDTRAALESAGFEVDVAERGELPMVPRHVKPDIAGRAPRPASAPGG